MAPLWFGDDSELPFTFADIHTFANNFLAWAEAHREEIDRQYYAGTVSVADMLGWEWEPSERPSADGLNQPHDVAPVHPLRSVWPYDDVR